MEGGYNPAVQPAGIDSHFWWQSVPFRGPAAFLLRAERYISTMDCGAEELACLAALYGTDKGTSPAGSLIPKNYTEHYARLFHPFIDEPFGLLEIGVKRGASLRMWKAFLPKAHIFGIDIDPAAKAHEESRIRIAIGSQNDAAFLSETTSDICTLCAVIDDGSHVDTDQLIALNTLFPFLEPGGFYAIEDLHVQGHGKYGRRTLDCLLDVLAWLSNDTYPVQASRWMNSVLPQIAGLEMHRGLAVLHKALV